MMAFNVFLAAGSILHLLNALVLSPARCFLSRFLPRLALNDKEIGAYYRLNSFLQIFMLSLTFLMVGVCNFVFGFYETDGKLLRSSLRFIDSFISPNLIAACSVGLLSCAFWLGALILKEWFLHLKSGFSNARGWCCASKEE